MQPLGVHLVISAALTYILMSRFMGHNSVDVGICDPYSHLKQHPPGEGMAHACSRQQTKWKAWERLPRQSQFPQKSCVPGDQVWLLKGLKWLRYIEVIQKIPRWWRESWYSSLCKSSSDIWPNHIEAKSRELSPLPHIASVEIVAPKHLPRQCWVLLKQSAAIRQKIPRGRRC